MIVVIVVLIVVLMEVVILVVFMIMFSVILVVIVVVIIVVIVIIIIVVSKINFIELIMFVNFGKILSILRFLLVDIDKQIIVCIKFKKFNDVIFEIFIEYVMFLLKKDEKQLLKQMVIFIILIMIFKYGLNNVV